MGWLIEHQKLRHETPARNFTREYTYENEKTTSTVLASATAGSTVYLAIHVEEKPTRAIYTYAGVVLFTNSDREGFSYKTMNETVGPYEAECPDRIMRLLSPIETIPNPGYAAQWRKRVAERKRLNAAISQARPGSIAELASAATLSNRTIVATRFRLVARVKRTMVFEPVDHPRVYCRLSKATLATAAWSCGA